MVTPPKYPKAVQALLDANLISEEQISKAQLRVDANGKSLFENIVDLGFVDEKRLIATLGDAFNLPVAELSAIELDPAVVNLLPRNFCTKHGVVALSRKGHTLYLGLTNPESVFALDEARLMTGLTIQPVLVGPESVKKLLDRMETIAGPARFDIASDDLHDEIGDSVPPDDLLGQGPRGGEREDRDSYMLVPVYYATDRARGKEGKPFNRMFTDRRNENGELSFGRSLVSIPRDHRVGHVERPSWLRLEFSEDPAKHVVVVDIIEYPEAALYDEIKKYVQADPAAGALLFLHGYNVSYVEALRQTAQIAADLEFRGPAISYAWPSAGAIKSYLVDENNARWSVPHLRRLLAALKIVCGPSPLHVLAHSMGSRVLAEAIGAMGDDASLGQVIFAAPDIDSDVFKELVGTFHGRVTRATLYASSNDEALRLSRNIHGGYSRAGESAEGVLVTQGVDSVDATSVNTDLLGHSYYGDNRSIITDIYALIRANTGPDERFGMRRLSTASGMTYWAFRP